MRRMTIVVIAVLFVVGVSPSLAQGPKPMPEKVRNALNRLVGTWTWVGSGGQVEGNAVVRWDPGKNYLINETNAMFQGERVFVTVLSAWDGVSEDGIVMHRVGPATSDSYRMKVISDTVMEGQMAGVLLGGKFSGKVRFVAQGPDQYTAFGTVSTPDEDAEHEMETVYSRAKGGDEQAAEAVGRDPRPGWRRAWSRPMR